MTAFPGMKMIHSNAFAEMANIPANFICRAAACPLPTVMPRFINGSTPEPNRRWCRRPFRISRHQRTGTSPGCNNIAHPRGERGFSQPHENKTPFTKPAAKPAAEFHAGLNFDFNRLWPRRRIRPERSYHPHAAAKPECGYRFGCHICYQLGGHDSPRSIQGPWNCGSERTRESWQIPAGA